MSGRNAAPEITVRAPRETTALFGHREAEQTLLTAYRSGRIPHAWLIGGAQGMGKATLAYRIARFVLGHPDPSARSVQDATSLYVDEDHPVARQVAGGSHGGLLTLERTVNEKGAMRAVITVDESRETIGFFGSTAASVGGWRVCVVDTVDELNANASNALLKILEEPPDRSLFLLVSHAPARVLATIQSRCRKLPLRPLESTDVVRAVAEAAGRDRSDPALREAASAAEGSVSRALTLLGQPLGLHQRTLDLLNRLPQLDPRALHALGDALPLNDRVGLQAFVDTLDRWLTDHLHAPDAGANLPRLARLAEVWEKINRAARETEGFNLERKPLVFSVFGMLAEATSQAR